MSKCYIWGVDILILVCVGASEYKFDRLLKIIDELCDEKIIEASEVVAQIGYTNYIPKNYRYFDLIEREQFQEFIDKADIIITHAGTGSVIPPLKLGKKIIVFPRIEEYKEHLDNHQLELSEVFTSEGYTLCAENKEQLINCINNIDVFRPKKFVSNKENINNMIIDFIENL